MTSNDGIGQHSWTVPLRWAAQRRQNHATLADILASTPLQGTAARRLIALTDGLAHWWGCSCGWEPRDLRTAQGASLSAKGDLSLPGG